MGLMDELIPKIQAFLDRHRMEPSAFGLQCANDSHLYFDLLGSKRKLRRKTRGKIEDFMRAYKPPREART